MTMFGNAIGLNPGNLGMRLFKPSAVAGLWWDPLNEGLPVVGAYRASATVGSPWPLAPANYADTLQDWSGTSPNLIEGNGAVPWAAATGWGFVAANLQYFWTGLVPPQLSTWSMLCQYNNATNVSYLCGQVATTVFDTWFTLETRVSYGNGGRVTVAPLLVNGNLAVAGNQGYRNGAPHGAPTGAWNPIAPNGQIAIGGRHTVNLGIIQLHCTANIYAVAIYNGTLTAPQVLAVATAMSQL